MQQDDIEQDHDATTRASKSHDKPMNDRSEDARRMAEELIAEEGRTNPRLAINTYFVAAIIGLIIWGVLYYLWQSL